MANFIKQLNHVWVLVMPDLLVVMPLAKLRSWLGWWSRVTCLAH